MLAAEGQNIQLMYDRIVALQDNLVSSLLLPVIEYRNTLIWKKNVQLSNLAREFFKRMKKVLK